MPGTHAEDFRKAAADFRSAPPSADDRDNNLFGANLTYTENRKRAEDCRLKARECEELGSEIFWLDLARRWEEAAEKAKVLALSDCLST
jgi:hypothetical protein